MIDRAFWKGRKVFLTGNTGFKGSWLSLWLHDMGASVKGYSLAPPTEPSLFQISGLSKEMDWVEGDIRDREKLNVVIKEFQPEIVIHMAAQPLVRESYLDPFGTYETNVMGTVSLLEGVRGVQTVKAVINVTTDKCYENKEWPWGYRENEPMGGYDPYSSSKGCSELVNSAYRQSFFNPHEYGKTHTVALASARAGNVIGGGDYAKDRLIPDIVRALSEGEKVKIRSPQATRPWQHVLEPLSGYLALAQALVIHGVEFAEGWNFGPNDSDARPVEWIVSRLVHLMPNSPGYELDKNQHPHEAGYLKLDISKAKQRLNWTPRWSLETTLKKIVEWNFAKDARAITLEQIKSYETVPNK